MDLINEEHPGSLWSIISALIENLLIINNFYFSKKKFFYFEKNSQLILEKNFSISVILFELVILHLRIG